MNSRWLTSHMVERIKKNLIDEKHILIVYFLIRLLLFEARQDSTKWGLINNLKIRRSSDTYIVL